MPWALQSRTWSCPEPPIDSSVPMSRFLPLHPCWPLERNIVSFSLFFSKLFLYLVALGLSCSTWDLVPWPEMEPGPPASGAQNLSHQTTRDVPPFPSSLLFSFSLPPALPFLTKGKRVAITSLHLLSLTYLPPSSSPSSLTEPGPQHPWSLCITHSLHLQQLPSPLASWSRGPLSWSPPDRFFCPPASSQLQSPLWDPNHLESTLVLLWTPLDSNGSSRNTFLYKEQMSNPNVHQQMNG